MFLRRFSCSMTTLIVLCALYFGTVMNYPVLNKIFELSVHVPDQWFFYTAPILLICAFIIIFSLFAWPYFFKPFMAFTLISSAAALYAEVDFHTLFDSSMMESIFETNASEATSYLNITSIFYIIVLGVLPTLALFAIRITPLSHLVACGYLSGRDSVDSFSGH